MDILEALNEVEKGKKVKCRFNRFILYKHKGVIYRRFPNGTIFKAVVLSMEEVNSKNWEILNK